MTFSSLPAEIVGKIDFQFPMSDLVAVVPYVLPLIFVGTLFFLYQRYLPREGLRRNLFIFSGLVCFAVSFFMILYAGFGSGWWRPPFTFGSWWGFVTVLQGLTNVLFGSIAVGLLYLTIVCILFAVFAYTIMAPPNPDFVRLNEELKTANEGLKGTKSQLQSLESENKRLKEFVSEKEDKLASLQSQLDALKSQVGEGSKSFADVEAKLRAATAEAESAIGKEEEMLTTIAQKDQRISALQSELTVLRSKAEPAAKGPPAGDLTTLKAIETKLKSTEAKLESMSRRADTATEVADSVISDLAHLISQVDSSKLDVQAKKAITTLIESLGKAVNRVSRSSGEKAPEEPRVEMIGAVMMIHEIVDTVKKMTRGQ